MSKAVVIVISVGLLFGGLSAWNFLTSVYRTVSAPHVKLLSPEFAEGPCQTDYFLFWQTGQHRMVAANFTLSNDGLSKAKVTVAFTVDGATSSQKEFFIEHGQSAQQAAQFQVNDCGQHQYWAQISNVEEA